MTKGVLLLTVGGRFTGRTEDRQQSPVTADRDPLPLELHTQPRPWVMDLVNRKRWSTVPAIYQTGRNRSVASHHVGISADLSTR